MHTPGFYSAPDNLYFIFYNKNILGVFSKNINLFYEDNNLTTQWSGEYPSPETLSFTLHYNTYSENELKKYGIDIKEDVYEYEVNYKDYLNLLPILIFSSGYYHWEPEKSFDILWEQENVKLVFTDLLYPTEERYFGLTIYIDNQKLEEIYYYGINFPDDINIKNIEFDKNYRNYSYNAYGNRPDLYFHDGKNVYCLRVVSYEIENDIIRKEKFSIDKFDTYDFSQSKECNFEL